MSQRAEPLSRRERNLLFSRRLLAWFRQDGRNLPWRQTRDPYAILVSEIMLQQTQVATVLSYYDRWLTRFPDFATLACADESAVLHAWQGLGYYARARNLRATAKVVVENFSGQLPAEATKIAALPGVGRYTAGAIASFAFDQPEAIVDANVARVLARLTNLRIPIDSTAGHEKLWQVARALIPASGARAHNSALMDLGALICVPRQPRCDECPVRQFCRAPNPMTLPIKKRKPATVRLTECHVLALQHDRILLERSRQRWRGMWMLPRLRRVPKRAPVLRLDFPFTHHRITLSIFARVKAQFPNEHQQWFPFRAIKEVPMPSPHRRAVEQLLCSPRLISKDWITATGQR